MDDDLGLFYGLGLGWDDFCLVLFEIGSLKSS
jgi:hypothetical protein